MCGKNLAERLWLPDMKADAVDKNAPQLQQAVRQVSETIGTECHLLVIHMMTSKGKTSHVRAAHLTIVPSRHPPLYALSLSPSLSLSLSLSRPLR